MPILIFSPVYLLMRHHLHVWILHSTDFDFQILCYFFTFKLTRIFLFMSLMPIIYTYLVIGKGTWKCLILLGLNLRKFSIIAAVVWAYPLINFQENLQLPCFFTYPNDFFPSYPLLLEPTGLLNLKKNASLPF